MSDDPVLTAERAHLELAERCLVQMRDSAERIADYGVDELASHSLGRMRAERLAHLGGDSDAPAFFGRTDRDPDADPAVRAEHPNGEVFHIGRRHLRTRDGDPVVIDWRAPIARPFYRATPSERQGVRLRRRFGFDQHARGTARLSSFEDEHLDLGENLGLESDLLRAEIERPRVGPMRDIVATIQPDQDDLVRAELDRSLCIQGAPGTGKTAVGLHRAAYLLYSYPDRLRHSGVLVVGPNAAFLRYIAQVLPALGENGISQTTVEQLVATTEVRAQEDPAVAVLKGDARMAEVLRRAVHTQISKPEDDVVPIVGTRRYRIPVERVRRYVDDARRSMVAGELRWDAAQDRLRMLLAQDVRRQREDAGGAPSETETRKIARSAEVTAFVKHVWPSLDARALLSRVFADEAFRARCGRAVLSADELALLHRPGPLPSVRAARFTAADQVLLDELQGLMTSTDHVIHVVLDEAQDLSAMQCRAVARRCPLGSVTVLGDLGQATTPWAPGSWAATMTSLGHPEAPVRPLTTGYRVPGEVLAVANRLLPVIAAEVPPATSVRAGGDALTYSADLVGAVRRCLAVEGSVAVIVADAGLAGVAGSLTAAGIGHGSLDDAEPARVTLVASSAAKGLEYDSVVLVEPEDIVAAEPARIGGLRRLYVCWTRAVSRLAVVHSRPLPAELQT